MLMAWIIISTPCKRIQQYDKRKADLDLVMRSLAKLFDHFYHPCSNVKFSSFLNIKYMCYEIGQATFQFTCDEVGL